MLLKGLSLDSIKGRLVKHHTVDIIYGKYNNYNTLIKMITFLDPISAK